MNYLAHLHLASLAESSLLGNLMADFVRGNPDSQFPDTVVAGIRMHRRIDVLTDTHPQVKAAKGLFSSEYRRVAPIALDVVWDHFLARHWSHFEPDLSLREFILSAESTIAPTLQGTPHDFQSLNNFLWRERWLERYAELGFLERVLNGMAHRRPRLVALGGIFTEIEQHYPALEEGFWRLYPDLMHIAATGAYLKLEPDG